MTDEPCGGFAVKSELDCAELDYAELDYAAVYVQSRFPVNPQERLELRDTGSEPTPLFVLVRTRLGCLWRFREDLVGAPVRELSKLAGREAPVRLPVADAPPPERGEPMARVLRDAGMQVEVARDLLVHRAGWVPTAESAGAVLFRVEAAADLAGLAQAARLAQMGSSSWKHCGALDQLPAREWIRFADLVRLVEVPFDSAAQLRRRRRDRVRNAG